MSNISIFRPTTTTRLGYFPFSISPHPYDFFSVNIQTKSSSLSWVKIFGCMRTSISCFSVSYQTCLCVGDVFCKAWSFISRFSGTLQILLAHRRRSRVSSTRGTADSAQQAQAKRRSTGDFGTTLGICLRLEPRRWYMVNPCENLQQPRRAVTYSD